MGLIGLWLVGTGISGFESNVILDIRFGSIGYCVI